MPLSKDFLPLLRLKELIKLCRPVRRMRGKQPCRLYYFRLTSGRTIEIDICEYQAF